MPDHQTPQPLDYSAEARCPKNTFAIVGSIAALLEWIPLVLLIAADSELRQIVIINWAIFSSLAISCSLIGICRAPTPSIGQMNRAITGLSLGLAGLALGLVMLLFNWRLL